MWGSLRTWKPRKKAWILRAAWAGVHNKDQGRGFRGCVSFMARTNEISSSGVYSRVALCLKRQTTPSEMSIFRAVFYCLCLLYIMLATICFIVLGPERVLFFSVSDILFSGSSLKKYLYQSLLTQQSSKTRRFVNSQLYSEHHKFLLSSIQVKSDDFHEGLRLVLI